MKYAIIIVKNEYEELGDFVFRPLIRAYEKLGVRNLLSDNIAIILGFINNNGMFVEYFTNKEIKTDNYIEITEEDLNYYLENLSNTKKNKIRKTILDVIFNEGPKKNESIEDIKHAFYLDACDRGVEFGAYEKDLSPINPYNLENSFLYKDFINKLNVCHDVKKEYMKKK